MLKISTFGYWLLRCSDDRQIVRYQCTSRSRLLRRKEDRQESYGTRCQRLRLQVLSSLWNLNGKANTSLVRVLCREIFLFDNEHCLGLVSRHVFNFSQRNQVTLYSRVTRSDDI